MTIIGNKDSSRPKITVYLSRDLAAYGFHSHGVRWIQLLKDAEHQLSSQMTKVKARKIVEPLWRLQLSELVGDGKASIAIFHTPESTGILRIPLDIPDRIVVADSFHIKPILYWVQRDPKFYLLALDSKVVRLFRGSAAGIQLVREVRKPVIQSDERLSRGARTRGSHHELKKRDTQAFFQMAEREFRSIIGKDRDPVIVAGVNTLIPIYRKVNRDPDLVSEFIAGSPSMWTTQELQDKSNEILGKLFENERDHTLNEFGEAEPKGKASVELPKIIQAAHSGQIRQLIIADDLNLWGSFDAKNGDVHLNSQKIGAEDDVLDDLAEIVLTRGGRVMTLPVAQMPHSEPVAAIFK